MVLYTKAVKDARKQILSPQILTSDNSESAIEIQCDTSKDAIGFCMMQKDKPQHFDSRLMNDAEINYARIGKLHLAICFAVNKL